MSKLSQNERFITIFNYKTLNFIIKLYNSYRRAILFIENDFFFFFRIIHMFDFGGLSPTTLNPMSLSKPHSAVRS